MNTYFSVISQMLTLELVFDGVVLYHMSGKYNVLVPYLRFICTSERCLHLQGVIITDWTHLPYNNFSVSYLLFIVAGSWLVGGTQCSPKKIENT